MKRIKAFSSLTALAVLFGAGLALGLQPQLMSQVLLRLTPGALGSGLACEGDNQCASTHCRLAVPDAGHGSQAICCSMGGESCVDGGTCCAESGFACTSGVCCQSGSGDFCESDSDCCLSLTLGPANAVNQCSHNGCQYCIPNGFPEVGAGCCSGGNEGIICCARLGTSCVVFPDGGSDACPPDICGANHTVVEPDFEPCVGSSQCASGVCVDAGSRSDAGTGCGGAC